MNRQKEHDARRIAGASYFTATLFRGQPHGFAIEKAATQDEAVALARTMLKRYPGCNRLPMIYAITPEGVSIHVRNISAAECER